MNYRATYYYKRKNEEEPDTPDNQDPSFRVDRLIYMPYQSFCRLNKKDDLPIFQPTLFEQWCEDIPSNITFEEIEAKLTIRQTSNVDNPLTKALRSIIGVTNNVCYKTHLNASQQLTYNTFYDDRNIYYEYGNLFNLVTFYFLYPGEQTSATYSVDYLYASGYYEYMNTVKSVLPMKIYNVKEDEEEEEEEKGLIRRTNHNLNTYYGVYGKGGGVQPGPPSPTINIANKFRIGKTAHLAGTHYGLCKIISDGNYSNYWQGFNLNTTQPFYYSGNQIFNNRITNYFQDEEKLRWIEKYPVFKEMHGTLVATKQLDTFKHKNIRFASLSIAVPYNVHVHERKIFT